MLGTFGKLAINQRVFFFWVTPEPSSEPFQKGALWFSLFFELFEKLQLFSWLVISWYVRYTLLLILVSSKFLASFSSCHSEESRVACRLPRQAPPGGANVSIGIQLLVFFSAYHHFFQLREVPHVVHNERLGSRCTLEVCLGIAVGPTLHTAYHAFHLLPSAASVRGRAITLVYVQSSMGVAAWTLCLCVRACALSQWCLHWRSDEKRVMAVIGWRDASWKSLSSHAMCENGLVRTNLQN